MLLQARRGRQGGMQGAGSAAAGKEGQAGAGKLTGKEGQARRGTQCCCGQGGAGSAAASLQVGRGRQAGRQGGKPAGRQGQAGGIEHLGEFVFVGLSMSVIVVLIWTSKQASRRCW